MEIQIVPQHVFAAAQAEAIDRIAQRLDPAGVSFILFKGQSLQRYYAAPAMRPTGDIDLVIAPGRLLQAARLLNASADPEAARASSLSFSAFGDLPGTAGHMDLHADLSFYRLPWAELLECSEWKTFGARKVRVVCEAHHFRIVCLHFLKHGAYRQVWLDDVCNMLAGLDRDFPWSVCTGGDPTLRNWLGAAINLAHRIRDADVSHVPRDIRREPLPDWLEVEARKALQRPDYEFHARPLIGYTLLNHPWRLPREVFARWPSATASFIDLGLPYGARSRRLTQIAQMALRGASYVSRIVLRRTKNAKRVLVLQSTERDPERT